MPGFFGTNDGHSGAKAGFERVGGFAGRRIKRWEKKSKAKGDFKNQAKLMRYQAQLEDWQQTQLPGHIKENMAAMRDSMTYKDADGNVLGNAQGSYKFGGATVSMGGFKTGYKAPTPESTTEKSDEGATAVTPRQFPGKRGPIDLGSDIPIALMGVNASPVMRTTRTGKQVPTGSVNFGTGPRIDGKFPMANEARIAKSQRDIQEEQGRQWHEQMHGDASKQGTLFDESGNPSEETK